MNDIQTKQFFSEQLDHDLAVMVKGIPAKHNRFVTDVFGDAGEENRTYTWLEAWRNASTDLWYLDQYTKMPDVMGDVVHKKKLSSIGICFFDALHYCSTFQQMELEKGRVVIPGDEKTISGLTGFREAATAAGQVIDSDGTAHPCADGRILTDGFFSSEALAIARMSAPIPVTQASTSNLARIVPQRDLTQVVFHDINTAKPLPDASEVSQHGMQKRDLINVFMKAADAGDSLMKELDYTIRKRGFANPYKAATDIEPHLAALGTLGLWPDLNIVTRNIDYAPEGHFQKNLKAFQKACAALPDCPEKSLLNEFSTTAHSVFYFERAANHYSKCVAERRPASKYKNGIDDIEKAARIAGKNEADIASLKSQYMRGEITPQQFLPKLYQAWDPYIGNTYRRCTWDKLYDAVQNSIQAVGNGSDKDIYQAVLETANRLIVNCVDFANKWPKTTPEGPMLRVQIHERVKALTASIG